MFFYYHGEPVELAPQFLSLDVVLWPEVAGVDIFHLIALANEENQ